MKIVPLILSFTLIGFPFGNGYSKATLNLDSCIEMQHHIDSRQDSLIQLVQAFEKSYEIKESLFSNELTILTTIFSTIVAISIFLIGYLIPRWNEEKHKTELKKLLNEFETIRDEIKESRSETAKVQAQNDFNNSKIMFFSCSDSGFKTGEFLWALRHCKDNYTRYEDSNDEDIVFYIDRALSAVSEISKEHNLRDYVDEVNTLTSELIELYTVEGIKDKLTSIKEQYNKIAWTEIKEDPNK